MNTKSHVHSVSRCLGYPRHGGDHPPKLITLIIPRASRDHSVELGAILDWLDSVVSMNSPDYHYTKPT